MTHIEKLEKIMAKLRDKFDYEMGDIFVNCIEGGISFPPTRPPVKPPVKPDPVDPDPGEPTLTPAMFRYADSAIGVTIFDLDYKWLEDNHNGITPMDLIFPTSFNGRPVIGIGYDRLTYLEQPFSDKSFNKVVFRSPIQYLYASGGRFEDSQIREVEFNSDFKDFSAGEYGSSGPSGIGNTFRRNLLEYVKIPPLVSYIPEDCFSHNRLKRIDFGAGLVDILDESFYNNRLTDIYLPNSIEKVGRSAFSNNLIETLRISPAMKEISAYSFYNNKIENLIIPDNIEAIYSYAFSYNSIKTLKLSSSIKTIGQGAFSRNQIEELTIPGNVEEIGEEAFEYNKPLRKIKLEEGVKRIGKYAFQGSSELKHVSIPDSITAINERAFYQVGAPFDTVYIYVNMKDSDKFNEDENSYTIRGYKFQSSVMVTFEIRPLSEFPE